MGRMGEMKRFWYRRVLIMIFVIVSIMGTGMSIGKIYSKYEKQQVSGENITNQFVIPGGEPLGIYMETDGVLVLGTDSIVGIDGQKHNPAENIVKSGDYIIEMNGLQIESKKQLLEEVKEIDSNKVVLKLRRGTEQIEVKIAPILTEKDGYKLGIWIKDNIQGLGTLTFITAENKFGALGHGIHDSDTEGLLEIESGKVYKARILNVKKGVKGVPGGMEGMIIYTKANVLGTIDCNTDCGVFGNIDDISSLTNEKKVVSIASKKEIKIGKAKIRCCVSGQVKEYDIEIVKIDKFSREANKGMMIKVADEELLDLTGGIVQGMSGSPIIQDGKLVGAVTHVLVNDPTRGYAIFIENMLDVAE